MARALMFAAAWWIFDLAVLRAGVPDRLDDTWEYGLVARALLTGQGFRTPVIHPPLWPLRDALLTVPVLVHGPLLPVLLALPLAIFGAGALDHVAWLGALGALAAVPALVRLGERCGDRATGFAAALLWTLSPLTLNAVHHDASLTLGAALAVTALELATRPSPRPAAAGLAIGLAALLRPELQLALPILALLAGRRAGALLIAATACLLPWWVHHARAVGQPFFNLSSYLVIGYWPPRPGISVMRDFALTPDRFPATLAASGSLLSAKFASFLPHAIKRALLTPTPATGWLAALGALMAVLAAWSKSVAPSPPSRAAVLAMLALAAIPVAVMTATLYDDRYLTPLLPLWSLAASRGALGLAMRMPEWARRPRLWIGLLLLLIAPTVAPFVRDQAALARLHARELDRERMALRAWSAERAARAPESSSERAQCLLFSDLPDFTAWSTGCSVVWVTSREYARLPLAADGSGLPVRGANAADDARFHDDEPGMLR